MSYPLQAAQPVLTEPTVSTKTISLLDMITHGGVIGTFVMIALFALFVISLYIFFERYFTVKKASAKDSSLINDIRDFIHEGKIDAAIELCKRTQTPEARILYKGLIRIGKPTRDISDSIENTAQLEIFDLEKNVGVLGTISGAAPMLGFLGTVIGMIIAFFATSSADQASPKMLAGGIYTAMANTAAGLIVGLLAYLFYNILVLKIDKTIHRLQVTALDFMDILNKPIS